MRDLSETKTTMFDKKKQGRAGGLNLQPEANQISAGTLIEGRLRCEGPLRVDGEIQGSVECQSKVYLGPAALVHGDITCLEAEILGRVEGALTAKGAVQLRGSASILGDVEADSLEMEPGARFNGRCRMGDQVLSPPSATNLLQPSTHEEPHPQILLQEA